MVNFLQQWKTGLEFLGEWGAESIHTGFNYIRWTLVYTRAISDRG